MRFFEKTVIKIITKIITNFKKHFHMAFGTNRVPKKMKKRSSVLKFRIAE